MKNTTLLILALVLFATQVSADVEVDTIDVDVSPNSIGAGGNFDIIIDLNDTLRRLQRILQIQPV